MAQEDPNGHLEHFKRDEENLLVILQHFSSLPYEEWPGASTKDGKSEKEKWEEHTSLIGQNVEGAKPSLRTLRSMFDEIMYLADEVKNGTPLSIDSFKIPKSHRVNPTQFLVKARAFLTSISEEKEKSTVIKPSNEASLQKASSSSSKSSTAYQKKLSASDKDVLDTLGDELAQNTMKRKGLKQRFFEKEKESEEIDVDVESDSSDDIPSEISQKKKKAKANSREDANLDSVLLKYLCEHIHLKNLELKKKLKEGSSNNSP